MQKVVLITGASSGIGFEAARMFAEKGYRVYGVARRLERMDPLKEFGVIPLKADLTDQAQIENLLEAILKAEGRLDILVNNAGYGFFGAIENVSMEDARRQIEVNVFAMAELCRKVIPTMREQGSGRIINTSSVAGRSVLYFGGWYHVSKYSVEALSDAMRMELKPFGIDVIMIEPGGIRTNWGIIAADTLRDSSKGTPYEVPALNESEVLRKAYTMHLLSSPAKVARRIVRAGGARCPRARYIVGFGSRTLLFLHHILPAKWWDAILRLGGKIKF